jgi:hypothetical protein
VSELMALERSCKFAGGYNADHSVVLWFWAAVDALAPADVPAMCALLTGNARTLPSKLTLAKGAGAEIVATRDAVLMSAVLSVPAFASKKDLSDSLKRAISLVVLSE